MNSKSEASLHIYAETPFSVQPVSFGIFPGFDDIVVLRHHDRFGQVLGWCRSYLSQRFSAEVNFKRDVVDSNAFFLEYLVEPFNGLPHFCITVRVFVA